LFGESSQQSVASQVWQVRRCTQLAPIFTHSAHSRRFGPLISVIAAMCEQVGGGMGMILTCFTRESATLRVPETPP